MTRLVRGWVLTEFFLCSLLLAVASTPEHAAGATAPPHHDAPSTSSHSTGPVIAGIVVECPGDTLVRPGRALVLTHVLANPDTVNLRNIVFVLRGERSWPVPFFPTDPFDMPARARWAIDDSIAAPDTAAAGVNTIHWSAGGASCSYRVRVPELITQAAATRTSRGVQLAWFAADSSADTVTIERRNNRVGEWLSIGRAFADGESRLAFEDRSVLPGYHYDYRLGLPVEQRQIYRGEVSVDVPPLPRLILYGARPNPSAHDFHLVFNLPAAGEATIDVLDVTGRRVASRSQTWTAGWNEIDLDRNAELRPGVYAVRLIQGGEIATAKVIRLR